MREHAPVYWDAAGEVWGITLYDDVFALSRDPYTWRSSGGIRPDNPPMPYMIDMDDPDHKKRRGLVSRGFTPRQVQEREPRIREISVDLIERAKARGCFDFVGDVAAWLPLIVIGDMLGVDPENYQRLLHWSDAMIRGTGTILPERVIGAAQAFEEYTAYQRGVIADRRAEPRDDLVSILVHAEVDGERMSDDELLMESLLILIGGDETTRHVLSGGMYELLRHPEQFQALVRDPSRIPTAVEEMLRWVSPIQNMARTAARDVVLRGQRIEAGQKALLLYPSANRDAAVFPDPLTFRPR
jgi:cytochrome P450 family 142 subfamily A polypeptide 1